MRTHALSFSLLALAMLGSAPAAAGPRPAGKTAAASPVYRGKPTPVRAKQDPASSDLSLTERSTSATALVGRKVALAQKVWAAVNVRTPRVHDRAALVFHDADVVDTQTGMARWSAGAVGEWTGLVKMPEDGLGGLTLPPVAHGMDVWIHADASHDYMVVCRVRLKSAKGDVVVRSDGGFELTTHVDHTGKSFGKVSWLVDAPVDGWYSFSIGTSDAWSTPGCWIDEI
jgi:hypothetical protein